MTSNRADPEIRQFVSAMQAAWREHPPLDSLPLKEARRVAEDVRGRFARGGPVMQRTVDLEVPWERGGVKIRVHDPGSDVPAKPALIYLHGGGWRMFSINTHDRIMREYAARANIIVVGVEYSLSPEVRFPHAIDETLGVIRWVRAHGAEHGLDATRLALGGDSAGAALTVSSCLRLRAAGQSQAIRAMVLNYGCFDPACNAPGYELFGRSEYLWDTGEMQLYWQNYLGDADARDPIAAPIYADLQGLPPAFLAIAELDVLRDDSIAMERRLREAGVAVHATVYPGTTHSFLEAVSMARVSQEAFADTAQWLGERLR